MSKITKRVVDAALPGERDQFVWDGELKGFGLKVTPAGRKVYIAQYRLPGRPTQRFTIGRHGSPWTPDGARAEAMSILRHAAEGQDPAAAKRAAKADLTIAELCALYLSEGARTKKASTLAMDRSRIEGHVKPLLGRKKLGALTRADIDRFLKDVAAGKTAKDTKTGVRGRSIVRGGQGVANRSLGMLGAILQFAIEQGLRADNPARGVKKYREGRRTRFLSNDEIARLGEALKAAEAGGTNPYAIAAIRLLVLTGCRKNEILSLKWDEVDIGGGFLRLTDSKTGAKVVHLGAPARALLASLPRHADNSFVMCGDRGGAHLVGLQKIWATVRAAANLSDVRLHDLRHSFASVAARSGESLLVIGKVLGHSTSAATGRYAHLSDDPVRLAVDATTNHIASALNGACA
jgi:integrase